MSIQKQYAERDVRQLDKLGNHFSRHMLALTAEDLYSKSDIAAELAWRDAEIEHLRTELSELRAKTEAQAASELDEIINRFPEINPSNYDHDDVCALNDWGVELVLAAERGSKK